MPALPSGLCAVSSSTFQVGKCARGPGRESQGGSHIRSPSPEGWVPLPLRASGLDIHLGWDGWCHAACVPLPRATLTEPMTQPWQPFPFLGFQTPGLGRLRLEQACTSEGGFLAAVTTRLFCPALS